MMIQNNLLENERIDDLQRNGYRIIQNPEKFCFGMDAVLLSGFANVKQQEKALDLGTGTGIIPILLKAKTKGAHFTGLEIQKESADMARRSVVLNGLEKDIEIVTGDIKDASELFGASSFDIITTNPPYKMCIRDRALSEPMRELSPPQRITNAFSIGILLCKRLESTILYHKMQMIARKK